MPIESPVHETAPAIQALLDLAGAADPAFREHSLNVAAVSLRVGETLGLGRPELEVLRLAAAVHDVGKLAVPAEIISKPGPLDEAEWVAMRLHPTAGANLLEPCATPPDVLAIVRSHHERWDGTGYPEGLAGQEIPLGARIIAVADAFWAMVETRPYRPPRRPAHAREELLAHSGSQFDPACAQAAYRVTAAAA